MQDFRKLEVWQEAQDLAARVHSATARLHGPGVGALSGQMRRSVASIGANIAEGAGHGTQQQFAHYLQIAIASASETESHLDLVRRRNLMPLAATNALLADVVRIRRRVIALRKRVVGTISDDPTPTSRPRNSLPETRRPETQN